MRFRKKPVVIEAMQWDGSNGPEIASWSGGAARCVPDMNAPIDDRSALVISTLEGRMWATPGDWIIRGVQGEFYPCKPDIFEATYELVADSDMERAEAADEIERLRRWKAEASAVLNEWGDMRSTMIPKRVEHLGLSSAAVVANEIGRLQALLNGYENLYGPPWWVDDQDGA